MNLLFEPEERRRIREGKGEVDYRAVVTRNKIGWKGRVKICFNYHREWTNLYYI